MRILPQDLDAEKAVLGAMLIDADAISAVRDVLEAADFYAERHQHIYRSAVALSDRGEPIDTLTLRSELERHSLLGKAGGIEYVAELSLFVPTAASVRHYADIVTAHALRRRLIHAGGDLTAFGFDTALTADEAIDNAEQRVFGLAENRRGVEATHIAPILKETWALLEARLENKKLVHGVPTNFSQLDSVTQGLQPGELVILAARPSVGKTSFALNIARNAAVLGRKAVAVFSLEMSKQALVQRLICSEAAVDSYLLKTGQADSAAFGRIAKAMDQLTQAELWIDDTPALTISSLRARARRMKAQHNIELIVIDYLQLMHGGRQESRVQEVSDISSGLKSVAKELSVPVMALSQLSRESERRENRRPQLSDLRDSGCLAAATPVHLADRNHSVPIAEVRPGHRVLSLDPATGRAKPRLVTNVFSTGIKAVHRLRTAGGRSIAATANHPFRTPTQWRRLDELHAGELIATPGTPSNAASGGTSDATSRGASGAPPGSEASATTGTGGHVEWDTVVGVEPAGRAEVWDLTIDGLHNFAAADIFVHNSIEQDADVVLFLYRPGMHKDDIDKSVTELIVAKNRNGPTPDIELVFIANQTAFREPHHGA